MITKLKYFFIRNYYVLTHPKSVLKISLNIPTKEGDIINLHREWYFYRIKNLGNDTYLFMCIGYKDD